MDTLYKLCRPAISRSTKLHLKMGTPPLCPNIVISGEEQEESGEFQGAPHVCVSLVSKGMSKTLV